jgi:hypothetical protein
MNKIMVVLSVIATMLLSISCEKNPNSTNNSQNPYSGTKWVHSVNSAVGSDYLLVFQFDNSTFDFYKADQNGNYSMGIATVGYTYSGSQIFFPRTYMGVWANCYMTGATINGSKMTLNYESYGTPKTLVFMKN